MYKGRAVSWVAVAEVMHTAAATAEAAAMAVVAATAARALVAAVDGGRTSW